MYGVKAAAAFVGSGALFRPAFCMTFTVRARVRVRFVTMWCHNYIVHKALVRIMHLTSFVEG